MSSERIAGVLFEPRERFEVFRCAILAASHAAVSMVVQLEADDLEARIADGEPLPWLAEFPPKGKSKEAGQEFTGHR